MKKGFKRTVSMAITVLLLAVAIGGTSVLAAGKTLEVTAALSKTSVIPGESIDYTLSLANLTGVESGIRSYKITVTFDSTKLTFSSAAAIGSVEGELTYSNPADGKIVLLYADTANGLSPLTAGEVAKITFIAKSGVSGTTDIAVQSTQTSFIDSSARTSSVAAQIAGRTVTAALSSGKTVTILSPAVTFGDLLVNENTKVITNVTPGTTTEAFSAKISNASGVYVSGTYNGKIATGAKLSFSSNSSNYSYTVVVYGDVDSDAAVTTLDLIAMKKHTLGKTFLTGVNEKAGRLAGGSYISILDLLFVKSYLVNGTPIDQNIA